MEELEKLARELDAARRAEIADSNQLTKSKALDAWRNWEAALKGATKEAQAKARDFYDSLLKKGG